MYEEFVTGKLIELPDDGTGLITNEFENDQSRIILLQVDKNGELVRF